MGITHSFSNELTGFTNYILENRDIVADTLLVECTSSFPDRQNLRIKLSDRKLKCDYFFYVTAHRPVHRFTV